MPSSEPDGPISYDIGQTISAEEMYYFVFIPFFFLFSWEFASRMNLTENWKCFLGIYIYLLSYIYLETYLQLLVDVFAVRASRFAGITNLRTYINYLQIIHAYTFAITMLAIRIEGSFYPVEKFRSRSIRYRHFSRYGYVICFNESLGLNPKLFFNILQCFHLFDIISII